MTFFAKCPSFLLLSAEENQLIFYRLVSKHPPVQMFRLLRSRGFTSSFKFRLLATSSVASVGLFTFLQVVPERSLIWSDASLSKLPLPDITESISVDKSVPAFPKNIGGKTDFTLLGYGTRSVTFLSFRVYALGIYIAKEDIPKVQTVLDSKFMSNFTNKTKGSSHFEHVSNALKDATLSSILVENLLDADIRFKVRIVPVRNTDFNHLKDGLIKSILASSKTKEIQREQGDLATQLDQGLDELRKPFTTRGSFAKGNALLLERLPNSSLELSSETYDKQGLLLKQTHLGEIESPIISKLLLLQYLSGDKPLSPNTKEKSCEQLSLLV
ncbi:uncharacterized protein PAS_FragB_0041 [Komagataella phaffii GS115]|uniref:Altered inheritance of mitochondria protein 18, mitochondrial n=2 Tax=Komagataella phaffii TaxID=460519 RepID=C4QZA0_KOMPG|nr:uncharacterized protein PAS_FragB_0041 [Komagataella phaffii GS115]AOA61718.1 GQ67_01419T0 [Komagataella phaffii]AOA66795.1 GQ68_01435T0 [Komagataella phaffii GS115]CAY68574.1 hypothetical protein PAS_FragB_0041 [Komagataella phaffii GS115]